MAGLPMFIMGVGIARLHSPLQTSSKGRYKGKVGETGKPPSEAAMLPVTCLPRI